MVVEAVACPEGTGTRPIEVTRPEKIIPAAFTIRSKAKVPGTSGGSRRKFGDGRICSRLRDGEERNTRNCAETGTRSSTVSCPRKQVDATSTNDDATSRRQQFPAIAITWKIVCSEDSGK